MPTGAGSRVLSQVRPNDLDDLLTGIRRVRGTMTVTIDDVIAHMVFQYLREQAVDSAPAGCDTLQNLTAFKLFDERPLDGFDLAANASRPIHQLLLLPDGM